MSLAHIKTAIVYDWLDKWGGVERVLLQFAEMFPHATFFTSYVDQKEAPWASKLSITPSFIQHLPSFVKKSRVLSLPLYPYAFESFNFESFDLVISVSSSFAKGVLTKPHAPHICYLLTPTRFLWGDRENYLKNLLFKYAAKSIREWDIIASQRPDKIIAISNAVKERCIKYYRRDCDVIYPPFDTQYWDGIRQKAKQRSFTSPILSRLPKTRFFLVVSRLEPYKKIDLVVDTFNDLSQHTLLIVGKGTQLARLKTRAKKNIYFMSDLSDYELCYLYLNALALIMPQEEDFGYTALEAQFFGCPVLSFAKGGVKEIVTNSTGVFFDYQTKSALMSAIERYLKVSYNVRQAIKKSSRDRISQFKKEQFKNKFLSLITES